MEKTYTSTSIIKNILQTKLYLFVVLVSFISLLILPIIGKKIIIPSFYNQMIYNILDEAKRVGTHISKQPNLFINSKELNDEMQKLLVDFRIEKIKVFDKNGYVTYSTSKKDIGSKNKRDYFYNNVLNGEVFHKVVTKGTKTLEDRIVKKDVAEIYIPIIRDAKVEGSSEVYYDITQKRENFLDLSEKIYQMFIYLSLFFLIFIFYMVYQASKSNLKEKEIDRQLKDLNENLKEKVQEQTKELTQINEKLEQRIKEEIEKSREKDNKLFQQSKQVAMGEMMNNIAHQWRQPLSVISTAVSGLQLKKELGVLTGEDMDTIFTRMLKSTNYLSSTIENFRKFFHKDDDVSYCQINSVINENLMVLDSPLKNNNIEVIYDESSFEVKTIKSELQQVLFNLLNNAKDVLEKNSSIENKYIFIKTKVLENKYHLEIYDNGGGIDSSIIDKIFEPYFTTKHKSQGTGLGLYMSKEILTKSLESDIEVENIEYSYNNKKYKGAKFIIVLSDLEIME